MSREAAELMQECMQGDRPSILICQTICVTYREDTGELKADRHNNSRRGRIGLAFLE